MVRWMLLGLCAAALAGANPKVETSPGRIDITGDRYRLGLLTDRFAPELELRLNDGPPIRIEAGEMLMAVHHDGDDLGAQGRPATFAHKTLIDHNENPVGQLVGQTVVLDADKGLLLSVHFLCRDGEILVGASVKGEADGNLWSPPRMTLDPAEWDSYLTWQADEPRRISGPIAELEPLPAYVGVTPWGTAGRTFKQFAPSRAGIVMGARGGGGLAVMQYDALPWANSFCFLQRHTPQSLYLYPGMVPASQTVESPVWALLFPHSTPLSDTIQYEARLTAAESSASAAIIDQFKPIAPAPPKSWTDPLPDFPAELRRAAPVADINDAMIYTMAETTRNASALDIACKTGSDMLVRGWFKWNQRPTIEQWTDVPKASHQMGALFGGGITCSALYDTENGITREQLLDMATRGPDGELLDAWDNPGVRHGTLSNPAYLDYLFGWCREQIDAGADYLFMDEINAALAQMEGFDDHSIADFRNFLLTVWEPTAGWAPTDPRWTTLYKVDLADQTACPDGTMKSFLYRAYLKQHGFVEAPWRPENALAGAWSQFRPWRDDRAWKTLTDRIRAYAKEQGRTVLISGNGIAKYVDLQVLGVWGRWTIRDGHITLDESQVPVWRSLVLQGLATAGREVPIVLFHDWGFGDPPFPFMGVPREDRVLWMRVRAPEIYAAGAKFAYPVLGPFGCDARLDGTLPEIANQTEFFQRHRTSFLGAKYLATDKLSAAGGPTSLIVTQPKDSTDLLLHVINRELADHALVKRSNLAVTLPGLPAPTRAVAISPDFDGEQPVTTSAAGGSLTVTVPSLDAYTLVRLSYATLPDLAALKDPIQVMPQGRWARPSIDQFEVLPDGLIRNAHELNAYLQGNLHPDLRRPPNFRVNALTPLKLSVEIRAVATMGAIIVGKVDGREIGRYELPDKDGLNDGNLPEYDRVLTFDIPAGQHTIGIENVGGDWAVVTRYRFEGSFGQPAP